MKIGESMSYGSDFKQALYDYNARDRVFSIVCNIWLGERIPRNFSIAGFPFEAGRRMNLTGCRVLALHLGDAEGNIAWPSLGDL